MKRRQLILGGSGALLSAALCRPAHAESIDLAGRLELFADDYLIAETKGDLERQLHRPEPKEVVFTADAPWEGNTSGYYTLFQDGDLYRMYYRGWAHDPKTQRVLRPELACYAESRDGIVWTRPLLGLHEFAGSKENNIVLTGPGAHNFTVFKDTNPACAPEARYKALGRAKGGLIYYRSADGIRWQPAQEKPVITEGAFDSQNLAYWDAQRGEYRAYWRIFTNKVRAIRTATSKDFVNWEPHHDLQYPEGTAPQHLYTNAIQPYFRAPHLFIGFPTRFLPDQGQRVEPVFMVSRDGMNFLRYDDPVVPEDAPEDRKGNRSNYMTWGLLTLPGKPDEMSVYATEAYYGPVPGRVRRFVYRLDGFVSLRGGGDGGGEALTKPMTVSDSGLTVNYKALTKQGSLAIEIQDETGKPLPGFALADCEPLTGDSVKAAVKWKGGDPESLHGKAIRLRLVLKNADLFSIQFAK